MTGIHSSLAGLADIGGWVLAGGGGVRTQVEAFSEIYNVFIALGTLVGIVVLSYMLFYTLKNHDTGGETPDRPQTGELPTGGGGGKKLLLSFSLSAIIVISLVFWTYGTLIYLESGPTAAAGGDDVDVAVTGFQFNWTFTYENGVQSTGKLVVPEDRVVDLTVTSRDVFHNFGIPNFNVKSDAIPGQTTDSWFVATETGRYKARCYELCGTGHSHMTAIVEVKSQAEYEEWMAQQVNQSQSQAGA